LRKLMQYYPIPVVVCSSLTPDGGDNALFALDAGAVAVVCKASGPGAVAQMAADLTNAVRTAAVASRRRPRPEDEDAEARGAATTIPASAEPRSFDDCRLVVLGASTGGTVAVESIVRALPADIPPLVVVQHLPQYISGEEAEDGSVLRPGLVVVAPGDRHVTVERRGGHLGVTVRAGAKVNGHRPSVDVLFHSAAEACRAAAVGVLLTGMGKDGAEGLLAMRSAGARTLVQDEASSVVWGMPKAAIDLGAVDEVVSLERMAARLVQVVRVPSKTRPTPGGTNAT
jgi:two-component system chemotaxis response regulator CheB